MIPLPDLSLHLAKTSTAVSGAGPLQTMFSIPFSFDNSGWNVASRSSGSQSATGATGQGSGAGGGLGASGLGDILGGINPNTALLVVAAYLLLRKKT
jgi:hypothetical protein